MKKLVECVPNFSEGRRPEIIDAVVKELQDIPGVFLLGKEMDADHNRAVVTIVGKPESTKEAAFRMIQKASELIDLTAHSGEHPRMGAADVVPFIPVENMTMKECAQLAKELGQRVGEELQIPVYLYEEAASRPERKNLSSVRKGEFEGLREEIGANPDRAPDYGPNKIHPGAGAIAIGARFFLVAYNVNLDTQDLALAKRIARNIRESSGGFPCVKAMGFELAERNIVQVSMNLVNYTVTSMATVYHAIEEDAKNAGVRVLESEIVGLAPHNALTDAAVELLKLRDFDSDQILENCIDQAVGDQAFSEETFLDSLASARPAPGGGSASAMAASLAAALATMVCRLTIGKKKYQGLSQEFEAVREQAKGFQQILKTLIEEDTRAFNSVMAAYKLPKTTDAENSVRTAAIQEAMKKAANVPLTVMKHALEVIKLAEPLAEKGNPNAITDIGCAVHLAKAALEGAALNVSINLNSIKDPKFIQHAETAMSEIQASAGALTQKMLAIVASKIRKI